jgi:hypothetical protein
VANIKVAILNASTVLKDSDVSKAVPALQTQVRQDFAPAWGIDADLSFVPKGSSPPSDAWWLGILDNSDQAGALGYHDLTDQGLPLGKVFAGTDLQYGLQWTVTASHELLEMLADPDINLAAYVDQPNGGMRLYAYEVCDPCEADEVGYKVDGTAVSDFVYPAWFESFRKAGSAQFDQQRQISAPFQLLAGGYIGIFDCPSGNGWTQITGDKKAHRYFMRPPVGSRRERRRTPREQWLRSEVKKKAR